MASNNLFPRRSEIFKGSMEAIRDTVARPSLDTLYQVNFSFGNYDKWLESVPGKKRTQGRGFQRKMSLLCTQAEIPGTSFVDSSVTGHHQGITDDFYSSKKTKEKRTLQTQGGKYQLGDGAGFL